MGSVIGKKELIQQGYEVLKNAEDAPFEDQRIAAEVARAYAKLAEALGDIAFYSVY